MKNNILPITTLRFFAALYVFLFHVNTHWPFTHSKIALNFLNHGACGMSLFFILSGFVLSYRFQTGVKSFKNYALARFTRIYPLYFMAALASFPWLLSSMSVFKFISSFSLAIKYGFIILLNVLLLQAWVPIFFSFWNDGGSWSISTEMFFYVCFPFLINKLRHFPIKTIYLLLIIFYFLSAFPGLAYVLFPSSQPTTVFYSIPIFRLSEFIIGVLCGLLFVKQVNVKHPSRWFLLSFLACCLYFLYSGRLAGFVGDNYVIVPLIAVMIFMAALLREGIVHRFMTHSVMIYLGKISYSFYTVQIIILLFFINHHKTIIDNYPLLKNNQIFCLMLFILIILSASLSYYFIENKFRIYLDKILRNKNEQGVLSQSNLATYASN